MRTSWGRGLAVGASSAAVLLITLLFLGGPAGASASGPTPCSAGAVTCIDRGLEAYIKTLAPGTSTPGFDASQVLGASSPLAQGSSDAGAIEQAFTALAPTITSDMSTAARNSVTAGDYESALNTNLDGDSNPSTNFSSGDFTLGLQASISPNSGPPPYTITLTLSGTLTMHDLMSLASPQLTISPPAGANSPMSGTVTLSLTSTFQYDSSGIFSMTPGSIGSISVNGQADYGSTSGSVGGDTNPLPFAIGPLSVTGTGTAQISSVVGVTATDPGGDGKITVDEMQSKGGGIFTFACQSGNAALHLSVGTTLSGLSAPGTVDLTEANVCDGVPSTQVALGSLGDFTNINSTDLVDSLALLTTSLRTTQQTGDLKLPFLDTSLSQLSKGGNVAKPLIKFFTDNGLTDPNNPMQAITFDPSAKPDLATIQPLAGTTGLAAKLAQSLGVQTLNPRFSNGKLLFDINVSEPAPSPALPPLSIDLGNVMSGVGLMSVKGSGTASASVSPSWNLNLTVGVDLAPGLTLAQRAFFQTGGTQFSADAPVTANNMALVGTAGPVSVALAPSSGCTTLLSRASSGSPMLSVAFDGGADSRLTAEELSSGIAAGRPPVTATINAKVPACNLSARATLGSQTLGTGAVGFAWPDITQTGGPNSFQVTADSSFTNGVLPLAYASDPRALLRTMLGGVRDALGRFADLTSTNSTFATSLPLLGGSIRDLAPYFQQLYDTFDSLVASDSSMTLDDLQTSMRSALAQLFGITPARAATMLTLSLTPATATVPAAVLLDLKPGVCTSDRSNSACLVTQPQPKRAFTLRLGPGNASSPSAFGIGTSGQIGASLDVSGDLQIGVQLPTLTPASGASSTPTVSGTPQPFVLDTSHGTVGVGATLNGTLSGQFGPFSGSIGNASNPATGCLALRLNLRDPSSSGARLFIPSQALATWVQGLVQTPLHDTGPFACPDGNDASASLPLFASGSELGTATFAAPDVLDPSGWQFDDGGISHSIASGDLNFSLVLAGLKQVATLLQNKLEDVHGQSIPLIGDHVGAAKQAIDDFQTDVIDPLQSGVNTFNSKTTAGALADTIRTFLWNHVGQGSGGADLILPTTVGLASATVSGTTATFTTTSDHGLTAGESVTVSGVTPHEYNGQWTVKKVKSAKSFTAVLGSAPSGPARTLGTVKAPRIVVSTLCKGTGSALATCSPTAAVSGLQRVQIAMALGQTAEAADQPFDAGFPGLRLTSSTTMSASATWRFDLAFGIDRTQGFFVSSDNQVRPGAPEISLTGNADLGGGQIDADIAFIPVALQDNHDGPDVAVQGGLDLQGGAQDHGTGAHLIGIDQLTNYGSPSGWSLQSSFQACANVQLGLTTTRDAADESSLPTISAELAMDGGITCTDSTGLGTGGSGDGFHIHFNNVRLDLGTWFSGFLKPAVDKLHEFLGPIEPMVEAIESPVPGISDAATLIGHDPISWYDVLKAQNGGDDLALLGNVITLVNIDEALRSANSGNLSIPIGSFDVDASQAGAVPTTPSCDSGFLENCNAIHSVIDQVLGSGAVSQVLKHALQQSTQAGFTYPAFTDPKKLFGLLLGQNPVLLQYDAGPLNATASVNFSFPLGPFTLGIGGGVTAKGHFVAGYDTQGIRDALQQAEQGGDLSAASSLLNGLFLDGHDASGQDVPELELDANVDASAGLGVTLNGSIYANLFANLITPADGRLRLPQIESELSAAHGNPLCLFKGDGKVGAKLEADLPFDAGSWTIADANLYQLPNLTSFCAPGNNADNSHGTVLSDGTLQISPAVGGTTGNDDEITLTKAGPSSVKVTEASGGSESTTQFDDVTQVYVDGGPGNDGISIQSGAGAPAWDLPTLLCGGDDNDTLTGGPTPDRLYGDGGGRMVTSSGVLFCNSSSPGADTLTGQGGSDQLLGGGGNDVLVGDAPAGVALDGSAGYNRLDGGQGDDTLTGNRHDRLIGGDGSDTIDFSAWSTALDINLFHGTVTSRDGSTSFATLSGIENAVGGSGDDLIFGSFVANRLEGGPGADFIQGDDSGRSGTPGGDFISGGAGNDQLLGSGGDDAIYGGPGNDHIDDSLGNDTIDGGDDSDTVQQGNAPNGADVIFDDGGSGTDVVDYSQRPSRSIAHLTAQAAQDGYANDGGPGEADNIQSGIETIDGPP